MTQATGGIISYANGKKIHTFKTSGVFSVTEAGDVEALVVAGGGGSGRGGGGAGGLIYTAALPVGIGNVTVTVGEGGVSGVSRTNGGSSVITDGNINFSTQTAVGGGAGGDGGDVGVSGGSGGGGTDTGGYAGGAGTVGQGNAGGGGGVFNGGGGGGGAGFVGSDADVPFGPGGAGNGGAGLPYSISGSERFYAGGGGGGHGWDSNNGVGGSGGGGDGGGGNSPTSGTPNTGGGAGGFGGSGDGGGVIGGSGVVIFSYNSDFTTGRRVAQNEDLADMVANTIKGRITSTGIPQDLTAAQVATLLSTEITERAQDAIGAMVADTATIDLTYTDGTPELKADVKVDSINDTHIDWGTGTNQVNLDDVPDGSTYVRITATNHTDLTDGGDTNLHTHDSILASANAYADGLVVGLWDDRGVFDASGGAYPSSGGSGAAGAILKGDAWTVSIAGTLPTGQAVEVGDLVRALIDTPGNTQANWAITQNNLTFPLAASLGGTGIANGASATLTLPNLAIQISGGVAAGNYVLPSTAGGGTFALLGTPNVFTVAQKINVNSTTAFVVEQSGVKNNTFVVDTTNGKASFFGLPHASKGVFQVYAIGDGLMWFEGTGSGSVILSDSAAATDKKHYQLRSDNGIFSLNIINDALGGFTKKGLFFVDINGDISFRQDQYNSTTSPSGFNLYPTGDKEQLTVWSWPTQTLPMVRFIDKTAATNTVRNVLQLETQSTGTAANGLGAGLLFSIETATAGTIQSAGRVYSVAVDNTNASRKYKTVITAFDTAERVGLEVEANGTVPVITIFGQTTGTSFISNIATGTQPYAATSTTKNDNLNADLLDGLHATDFSIIKQNISLLAQVAAIGSTAITGTNTAGLYRVSYYLEDTTADLTAGTIQVSFAYSDDGGATTLSSIALPLTAIGRTQGTFYIRVLGTGSISYSSALVGIIGTSQYGLFISAEKLL